MDEDHDRAGLQVAVARLRLEHEDMKLAIEAMTRVGCNPLAVQRMKKKKLELKDRLEKAASRIIPEISA